MWRLTRTARTSGNSAPTEDVHILSQSATDAPPPSIRQYSYLREMCRVIGTRLALRDIAPMEDIHFLAAISAGTRHAAAFSAPRACTLARTQADVFGRSNHMSSHAAPARRRYAASKPVTDCGPCSHRLLRHREACCRAAKLPRRCPRPRLRPASWRAPSMYTACRP